jgi:D-glycero-alpha-D-manno-heptose-7-phosphate kinase
VKITVNTPTRVDLAGGTLDIYPLYVFEGGSVTVNCAINLQSSVVLERREDTRICIRSQDLGEEIIADSLKDLEPLGVLDLMMRAVKFSSPSTGLNIETRNTVPKGSGLGASSSLLVALLWALQKNNESLPEPDTLIDWCANVEAQSLGIPTGKQDYYAAFFGGVSAIFFDERGIKREELKLSPQFLQALGSSLVLSYTGISHFSGATNWDMMKGYIDNSGPARRNMKRIKATAYKMREALMAEDLGIVAQVLSEEWENRKDLASGVTNARIDSMVKKAAASGALSSKICGAGGGGCMITIVPPGHREKVIDALKSEEAIILDFSLQEKGLQMVGRG